MNVIQALNCYRAKRTVAALSTSKKRRLMAVMLDAGTGELELGAMLAAGTKTPLAACIAGLLRRA